ncbi:glutamate-cysteine ligase family protein [Pendulispora brunnea]|uniref:Glutamate--cysteine ligase n=1 Tax=Pendulispora brunnea TaxID=2905690 RepID=A0ABZ2KEE0_9BACT
MTLSYEQLLEPFVRAMKPEPMWRVGIESEKFGIDAETLAPLPYEGERGVLAVLSSLARHFGFSPVREHPDGPLLALSRDGESITLEPGGQLELSGAPMADLHRVADEVARHGKELRAVSEELGIRWLGVGFHPLASTTELPWVPKARYPIMREYLPQRGTRALDMMRRTCTVQANFDYASDEDAMRKLRVALKLSPIVTAMFANSPFVEGRKGGVRSERARVWLSVDPDRQGLLPALWDEKSRIRDYVEWALDVPMFLFKRGGKVIANTGQTFRSFWREGHSIYGATLADWEMHLNTLFPEVRLKRTIEVRGADSVSSREVCALPALWTGILYDQKALGQAEELSADWTYPRMENLRRAVARDGLGASFFGRHKVRDVALQLFAIAEGGLRRRGCPGKNGADETILLAPLADLVGSGRCPADRMLEGFDEGSPVELGQTVSRQIALRAEY